MRVVVVGASGAIGSRLVPQLIDAGQEVIGIHASPGSGQRIRALGAEPVASVSWTQARCTRPCAKPSRRGSSRRRPHSRTRASAGTSTVPSRRPTGCTARAPRASSPPRAKQASRSSSRRASPACATRARVRRRRACPGAGVAARDGRGALCALPSPPIRGSRAACFRTQRSVPGRCSLDGTQPKVVALDASTPTSTLVALAMLLSHGRHW